MSQKVLSFFLAFALVLSLTRIVFLTDIRAEEIAEARNDVVVSPSQVENSLPPPEPAAESPDELHPVDDLTESDSIGRDEWLEIMREQEELMTPEIRASIRENVKAGLKKQLEERFGSVEAALNTTASASELGFASEDELQMWQDTVRDVFQPNASSDPLTLNHTDYSISIDEYFSLFVYGYNNLDIIEWVTMTTDQYVSLNPYPGGSYMCDVTGKKVGGELVIVKETDGDKRYAICYTEVFSFIPSSSSISLNVGASYNVTATTSHSNSNIAIRIRDNIGGVVSVNGTTISGVTPGTAKLVVYLVDRPTVCKELTVTVTASEPMSIQVSPSEAEVYVSERVKLTPTIRGTQSGVVWGVNASKCSITQDGWLTGIAPGLTSTTARISGTNIGVTIPTKIYGISSLSATSLTLIKGQYNVLSIDAYLPSNARLLYGTNDPTIAMIDDTGRVTAVGAGSTNVGIWVQGHNSTLKWCSVTVIEPTVTIADPGKITEKDTGTFSATVTGMNNYTLVWTSSDSSKLEITNSSTGAYKARDFGTVTVTARIANTNFSSSLQINIRPYVPSSGVRFAESPLVAYVGQTITPELYLFPADKDNPGEVVLTANPQGYVSISGRNITALRAGYIEITAHFEGVDDTVFLDIYEPPADTRSIRWSTDSNLNTVELTLYIESERTYQRIARIYDDNVLTNQKPRYTSNNESVAIVMSDGTVRALSAGSAVIRASISDTDISIEYTVNVTGANPSGASLYLVPFEYGSVSDGSDVITSSTIIPVFASALAEYMPSNQISVNNGHENEFHGLSPSGFCMALASSKIFYIQTHGVPDHIYIMENYQNIISGDDLDLYMSNGAISGTNLVILAACDTGNQAANLSAFGAKLKNKGAKIVINMNTTVDTAMLNSFMDYFIDKFVNKGATIASIERYIKFFKTFNYATITFAESCGSWTIQNVVNN